MLENMVSIKIERKTYKTIVLMIDKIRAGNESSRVELTGALDSTQ